MLRLASLLPEFDVVMAMQGAGEVTGPQLMAEIGDVRRFTHKGALVAFAGMDAPPFQSGTFDSKSRRISMRKTLFMVVSTIIINRIYIFQIQLLEIRKQSDILKRFYPDILIFTPIHACISQIILPKFCNTITIHISDWPKLIAYFISFLLEYLSILRICCISGSSRCFS